ncbi:MAG: hypothetical protein WBH86_12405 [Thermogutta sp.]|nr:hypothetical protein [Thermogutta sp.]HPU06587.1 hypothetical protein [Thermogutta sp.]HPZ83825.1 hypothetical protein [Thermogutta sp.]HQF15273.1 hypothetical protein [Thermogutta sp.]
MTKTAVIQAQQRWEYVFIQRRSELALQDELNVMGQQGWELVHVEYYKDAKGIMGWIAFLKRPSAASKPPGTGAGEHEVMHEKEPTPGGVQRPMPPPDDVFEVKTE